MNKYIFQKATYILVASGLSLYAIFSIIDLGFIGIFVAIILLIIASPFIFLATRPISYYKEHDKKLAQEKKAKLENGDLQNEIPTVSNFNACPNCSSKDIQFMQNNKKSFSVGKAAAGAALTGGIGTLAGFAGKKGKNQWFCKTCGSIFETK